MKALLLQSTHQYPELKNVPLPSIEGFQKLVRIKAAALNHRDVWIKQGKYAKVNFPFIPGSDGAGVVDDGREVVIQPGSNWGNNPRFQARDYSILGMPANGTFAEYVAVHEEQLFDKPSHLSFLEAAAIPLAGLTAYRVLFSRCGIQPGEKMLITGIGGGVALCCLQFALAYGLEVYVTSSSDDKIERALELGASGGVNYRRASWAKELTSISNGFDIVIDSAGGDGFSELIKMCNPGGRIGLYGGAEGLISNLSPQGIFWKQLSILGSTMGNDADFMAMLSFVSQHKVVPVIDSVFPLEEGASAFEKMEKGAQFGKIILKVY